MGQTRIHLDQVEGLGSFVELEVVLRDDQTAGDGGAIAQQLLGAIGVPALPTIWGLRIRNI